MASPAISTVGVLNCRAFPVHRPVVLKQNIPCMHVTRETRLSTETLPASSLVDNDTVVR